MRRPALILLIALLGCGRSQGDDTAQGTAMSTPTPHRASKALSLARIQPRNPGAALNLASDSLGPDLAISAHHSAYGDNFSPPLRWSPVERAGSYALIVEDPDAPRETPFVHWLIWNIPGGTASLPEGLPATAHLTTPRNAMQGRNDSGAFGYFGPRPPVGHGPHHYHFQIFALDGPLDLKPESATLRSLLDAMKDRVLADGDLVGTFEAPARH